MGEHVGAKGENNVNFKLTDEEVKSIKELHKTGNYFQKQIARKFNTSQQHVSEIVRNVSRISSVC